MAINPARLRPILINTGLQQKDNPLWQFLNSLLDDVIGLSNAVNNLSPGGGGSSVINNNQFISQFLLSGSDGEGGGGDSFPIPGPPGADGSVGTDYVVASDGGIPTPQPLNDGFGNFIYIPYVP